MTNSQGKMQAIILAAGLGKRMRSSTAKVMHPVLGRANDLAHSQKIESIRFGANTYCAGT